MLTNQIMKFNRFICSAAAVSLYAVVGSLPAQAGVYDDCIAWWHFDYDADSDSRADLDEIRDQRDWGTAALKGAAGKHATQILGASGGPGWTNSAVISPAGGQNYGRKSMYFSTAVDPVTTNCYPDTFRVADLRLAGSVSLVTRFCYEGYPTSLEKMSWLINNHLEWNLYRGWLFGIRDNNFLRLSLYTQMGEVQMDVAISTGVWYDVAMVLTDSGTNSPTDTVEFYLWKENGALSYRKYTTTTITNSIGTGGVTIGCEAAPNGYATGNARKSFKGAVNHLAFWDRALSSNEVNEAFGHPQPLFQIGLKNNSSFDLRMESETDAEYWRDDPWHTMRRALTTGATDATLKLELNALQSALDYAFHLRTAASDGGQSAAIEMIVNSTPLPAQNAGPAQDLFWHIPQELLVAGTNSFTLHYLSGPAAYIAFDWMELGGAWQVGYDNGSQAEFSTESAAPDDFYVTNPNWLHLERALTVGDPTIHLHFSLSSEMIKRYWYSYTTRVISQGDSTPRPFSIGVNGTILKSTPGVVNNTLVSVSIPGDLLAAGDNTINLIYNDTSSYMQFDFHRMELHIPGTLILIR